MALVSIRRRCKHGAQSNAHPLEDIVSSSDPHKPMQHGEAAGKQSAGCSIVCCTSYQQLGILSLAVF